VIARLFPDRFIFWMLATLAVASILPVRAAAAEAVDLLTLAAIFALFFLHGVRLPRAALVRGIADWRLHAAILASTYLLFPAAGIALSAAFPSLLAPELWTGILFLCALPSTVQSSIAFTSIARGNVAGAVAAAAGSNLLGVFLTPLLISLMMEAQGAEISLQGIGRIVALLFFPFLLGHGLRPWLFPLVADHPRLTAIIDKGTILLAVYGAFSAAMVEGMWTRIPAAEIGLLIALCLALLGMVIAGTLAIGRLGGFSRENRVAILLCGSVKSLASGVAMARVLFPGATAGFVILPVMIFHTVQLIVCAWIAGRMAAQNNPQARAA
jgi:solute carrier family 10 (sodium/bile acid cotransporter), member 7